MAESCGQCTPCREGILQMRKILDRITDGEGKEEDLDTLEWMGQAIICARPNPRTSSDAIESIKEKDRGVFESL